MLKDKEEKPLKLTDQVKNLKTEIDNVPKTLKKLSSKQKSI